MSIYPDTFVHIRDQMEYKRFVIICFYYSNDDVSSGYLFIYVYIPGSSKLALTTTVYVYVLGGFMYIKTVNIKKRIIGVIYLLFLLLVSFPPPFPRVSFKERASFIMNPQTNDLLEEKEKFLNIHTLPSGKYAIFTLY